MTVRIGIPLTALLLVSTSLLAQARQEPRTLASFATQFASGPKPSPNGRFLLYGTRADLRIYEVATRQSRKIADGRGWELAWSPKGDRIAWVRDGDEGVGEFIWTLAVDPQTATPREAPQRVTLGQGEFPAISLDGKWMAYVAPDTEALGSTNGLLPHHLAIVPVTGGPDRVLTHFKRGAESLNWSADGKTVYLGTTTADSKLSVLKVPISGGPVQVVRSGSEFMVGMTADRTRIVMVPAKGRVAPGDSATVVDTTGRVLARVPLPVGTPMSYEGLIGDTSIVWIDVDNRRRIEVKALANGAALALKLTGESNEAPAWSPSGKAIAFRVREKQKNAIAVVNADRSNLRVYREVDVRTDPGPPAFLWSPDSKSIGFVSADWHTFMVLDVASGKIRTVVRDSSVRIGYWTWGRGNASISAIMIKSATPPAGSVEEVTVGGSRRTLFDFTSLKLQTNSGFSGFSFADASTLFYRTDSASFTVNLGDRSVRRLSDVPAATLTLMPATSTDHKLIAATLWDSKHPQGNQLELIAVQTGERRILDVPFRLVNAHPVFTPDNRTLLLFGRRQSDTTATFLYSVPIDGGAPRVVSNAGDLTTNAAASISPDGNSVAYTVDQSHALNLLLVDIRNGVAASRRPRGP
jgi:Tol biopolymer transport system component